jgi:ATP-dependent Clp protease ATP-binding subunit ClpX
MSDSNKKQQTCSFCGRTRSECEQLFAGPGVAICNHCVDFCYSVMHQQKDKRKESETAQPSPKPHEIKKFLDKYVIGQEFAKKVLSVAVYNHYKRINQQRDFSGEHPLADVEIEKSNILLIGPTGCGKTLLAQTLARFLGVPFTIADATPLTEAGYVGEDVENILLRLIQAADMDVERAEQGIIYIDEIDKIGRKTENVSITRDVSGEGVQQALLKILEGTVANVPMHGGRKHPQEQYLKINTNSILFICGGAFTGLDEIVKRRIGTKVVGFRSAQEQSRRDSASTFSEMLSSAIEPEDLIHFGLIPELVGRLPVNAALHQLNGEDLVRVLTDPQNSMIKQYQKLFAMENTDLKFEKSALKKLAELAIRKKTGARGLRTILETVMLNLMFDVPSRIKKENKILVTPSLINKEYNARPGLDDKRIA